MRINNNIMAMNTHRQLGVNAGNASKSVEKLSSGLRINRAGDDAAGLAISEKMRGQVRGLNQASRNAQDGISLIQTAEGALNESEAILQRMRELSVQASNATYTDDDRDSINNEVSQLKSEIDRIAETTEFNTKKLLNGDLSSPAGALTGENETRGAVKFTGTKASLTQAGADFDSTDFQSMGVDFTGTTQYTDVVNIDGHEVEIDWNKHLSDAQETLIGSDYSATNMTATQKSDFVDAVESAINAAIDEYNAENLEGAKVEHIDVYSTGGKMKIESQTRGTDSKIEFVAPQGAASANLVTMAIFGEQATASTVSFVGNQSLVGSSGDWEFDNSLAAGSMQFKVGDITLEANLAAGIATDDVAASATSILQAEFNSAITEYNSLAGLSDGDEGFVEALKFEVDAGRFVITSESGPVELIEQDGETKVEDLGLNDAQTTLAAQGAVSLQIGANKDQVMQFSIGDMRTQALGVAGTDVSSIAGASKAITELDDAIKAVSAQRSDLGAYQNRLEHTSKNLDTSSENLQAAESRIRDVDMAKEMMTFTKNNILQQAAQSMLAQANQAPQGVLQLLR